MGEELQFDWDDGNRRHISRHRVNPVEVEQVLMNSPADVGYDHVDGEERWTVIGHTNEVRVLVVTFTMRGLRLRPITAHDVVKRARRRYLTVKGIDG